MPAASSGILEESGAWSGGARMAVEDDFENGSSRPVLYLSSGGETLEVNTIEALPEIPCETAVKVRGLRLGRMILATGLDIGERTASGCSTTGEHRTVVILVTFPSHGLPAAVTPQFMSGAVFGSGRSFKTYVQEAPYGRASVTGTVVGPYALGTNYACSQTTAILNAAIQAADNDIDFRQFTRIVVAVPNSGSCSIGVGSVGCWSLPRQMEISVGPRLGSVLTY